jgi:hypothetical protein
MSVASRLMRRAKDIEKAKNAVGTIQIKLQQPGADFKADTNVPSAKMCPLAEQPERASVRLPKTDVQYNS